MTENEAKEELKTFPANCLDFKENQALHVATKALEEIKQYRAIGTVEQLEWCKDASHWKELFKDKLEQYEAIGTVEELKALKQKNNEHYSDTDELDGYGYTCTNKTCVERIRNKAIDEFYDEVLNFEDYIEPSGTSEFGSVLLYSGKDITNMICKIAEQLKAGGKNE